MAFKGWPVTALEFYEGLEADNSKVYWNDHRDIYEREVKGPMVALLEELSGEFGDTHLFRPHRDVRFSADKSPYKTAIAATVGECYVSLSADGLTAGGGTYHMAPDQLQRYRAAVTSDPAGAEIEAIVARLTKAHLDVAAAESLKTAPRGYAKDHPRIDLLRRKGLVALRQWPAAAWFGTPTAKQRIVEVFELARPLVDWLAERVGPTEYAGR